MRKTVFIRETTTQSAKNRILFLNLNPEFASDHVLILANACLRVTISALFLDACCCRVQLAELCGAPKAE